MTYRYCNCTFSLSPFYKPLLQLFLPPANEVWDKVLFSEACVKNSVQRGVVVSQHALQVVSQHALQVSRGMVSQHALQVSRPTPKGEVERSGFGGFPGPHLGGSPGSYPGESPGPHPGELSRPTPRGGLQAHTQRGSPGPHLGGIPACTEADPPPQQMATAVGGTHPTGMHSCVQ